MRSRTIYRRTFALLASMVVSGIVSNGANALTKGETVFAKSTFLYLANPDTKRIDIYNFAYLPAGTRLRYEGKAVNDYGKRRLLISSETGVFGYIREDLIWKNMNARTQSGQLGIFQRKYRHEAKFKSIVNLEIFFTRGESYKVVDKEIDSWVIQVDLGEKLTDEKGKPVFELSPGTKVVLKINVPMDYLTVIDFAKSKDSTSETDPPRGQGAGGVNPNSATANKFPPLFHKSIIDGIAGIEKPCNTQKNRVIRTGAGGGFDLKKFFVSVKLNAERETEEIEVFPKRQNVTRTYYTRDGYGTYRLTQYKDCSTNHYEFSFLKPGNDEVSITKTWARENKLDLDVATGKIKITCPPQYFSIEDALTQQGFDRAESSFIISKIGRWRNLSAANCK